MATRNRRRGVNKTGRSKGDGRFVKLEHYLLCSQAWRSLSPGARSLLIEIWERHNGINNGEISYSVREAARSIGCSKNTAAKWFRELEQKGFLKQRQPGSFTCKVRHATEWEITAEPYLGRAASKDFMRWPQAGENQNAVPTNGTNSPNQRDRGTQYRHQNSLHGPNQRDRRAPNTPRHGPTERDASNIPGGFQANGSGEKRDAASLAVLLAIPECFDRRRQKNRRT